MVYSVRDSRGGDVDKLAAIIGRVLAEAPTYAQLTFDHDKTARCIVNGIMRREGWFLRVIADENDEPVGGLCGVNFVTEFGPDKVAYDITMMIDKPHRGRCVRQFIQCCEEFRDWAIKDGAKIVKLGISSGMQIDKLSSVLERLEFVRIGATHAYIVGE